MEKAGLYIHVPFCKGKCPYCGFYSIGSPSLVPRWLDSVQIEAEFYQGRFPAFDSLYLGGGTPSLLQPFELSTLARRLFRYFPFSRDLEWTIEVNPDDITADKLSHYRELGINRISMGVQSFHDRDLQFLKRRHTARQALDAIDLIRNQGWSNMGIDLIYALPGQKESEWQKNLERAMEFLPEHLSCYQLTIEEKTPFAMMLSKGLMRPPGEEMEKVFFLLTSRFLEENGYTHYEISNFARGMQYTSRHNLKYWRHAPYLGLGPSAHSFLNGKRWWNVRSLRDYQRLLSEGKAPIDGSESLTEEQHRLESLMLGFRTKEGISMTLLQDHPAQAGIIESLLADGLLEMHENRIIPTTKGFLIADRLPLLIS